MVIRFDRPVMDDIEGVANGVRCELDYLVPETDQPDYRHEQQYGYQI